MNKMEPMRKQVKTVISVLLPAVLETPFEVKLSYFKTQSSVLLCLMLTQILADVLADSILIKYFFVITRGRQ